MRNAVLASILVLGMAGMASAQTASPSTGAATQARPTGTTEIRPGHVPGVGDSYPASNNASNIVMADTRSTIAPRLPTPPVGENATVGAFLSDAQQALKAGRTGEAQEALERAETAMLQRSVPASQADTADEAPDVTQIKMARDALANRDIPGAQRDITAAMSAGS